MRAVFIGGAGRSGTTLLGDLLGAHPDHICTPETSYKIQLTQCGWGGETGDLDAGMEVLRQHRKFKDLELPVPSIQTPTLRALFDAIIPSYGAQIGKPAGSVWIDHTPSNLAIGGALLRQFPASTMIHVVRDGRAVAASAIPLDWGPNNVIGVAREWVLYVALGLALEGAFPGRVLRIKYEDLVQNPAEVLSRICTFAGLQYRDDMVRGGGLIVPKRDARQHALVGKPPDPSRAEAWRSALAPRHIEIFEAEVSSVLELMGYVPMFGERARELSPLAALAYEASHVARSLTVNRLRRSRRSA